MSVIDGVVWYKDLENGQSLVFSAIDARTRVEGLLAVQVVKFIEDRILGRTPIYMFLNGGNFHVYGTDRVTPKVIPGGTLAHAGFSAECQAPLTKRHSFTDIRPCIAVGQDYSFKNLDGERELAFVKLVTGILIDPAPPGWKPPEDKIDRFLAKMSSTKPVLDEKTRKQRLRRALTIVTDGSVYELSEVGTDGHRSILRFGDDHLHRGDLVMAEVGRPMIYVSYDEDPVGITTRTRVVKSITPDPHKE